MKKLTVLLLTLLMLISVTACGEQEKVDYHIATRKLEYNTGDVNLTEYTYDDQWNILSTRTLLNGEEASSAEYTYSEDLSIVTMHITSKLYDNTTSEGRRTFDENGNVLTAETYTDGKLTGISSYTYDEKGREISVVNTAPDSENVTKMERSYDENGNLLTYTIDTGYYVSRQEYTYDKQNRRLSRHDYQNDDLVSYIEYAWEGNVQSGTVYDAQETVQRKVVLTYDKAGNLLVEEYYDILDSLQSRTSYTYIGTDGSTSGTVKK